MIDFVMFVPADLDNAFSKDTAVVVRELTSGSLAGFCVDSTLDVDAAVMIDDKAPIYIRSGGEKIIDLVTNKIVITTDVKPRTISVYLPNGVNATMGNIVFDAMF